MVGPVAVGFDRNSWQILRSKALEPFCNMDSNGVICLIGLFFGGRAATLAVCCSGLEVVAYSSFLFFFSSLKDGGGYMAILIFIINFNFFKQ